MLLRNTGGLEDLLQVYFNFPFADPGLEGVERWRDAVFASPLEERIALSSAKEAMIVERLLRNVLCRLCKIMEPGYFPRIPQLQRGSSPRGLVLDWPSNSDLRGRIVRWGNRLRGGSSWASTESAKRYRKLALRWERPPSSTASSQEWRRWHWWVVECCQNPNWWSGMELDEFIIG